jgi:hypothetical protein
MIESIILNSINLKECFSDEFCCFTIPAGRYWPLYGYEFGRIKFGNMPTDGQT